MSIINIKINDQAKTVAEHTVVTQNGQPTILKALDKVNYELFDKSTGHAPNRIISKRNVKDLHVSFENGTQNPDLIIEGFYDSVDSALTGIAEDGSYYYYVPDTGEIADYVTELQAGDTVGQALGGNAQTTPWWASVSQIQGVNVLPWLAGLTGVGALGAVASSGSDDNSNSKPAADTQAPDAPTNIIISINGVKVTGKGEPRTKVEIKNSKDSVIGESIVKDDGTFEVELNTSQTNGEEINVTLIDNAGNVSAPTNITAPDTTAPNAPVVDINADGSLVTVTGEEGATVSLTTPNGLIEGTIENGSFTA
ncbi:Ig-like domain-containing protein, partial [uncultured Psychrobacter sp.]|uniref:Ig-like domain-containing protein n=1 Tax=uncultured Psychrobacter sp. TaxID=259303 RepID=UPI00262CCAC5